jgi:hypothetical protein
MHTRHAVAAVAVAGLVLAAGCGQLLGGGGSGEAAIETVTPAPVPESTATPTETPTRADATETETPGGNGALVGAPAEQNYWTGLWALESDDVTQPRYLSLRPTCERPPGLVIHIQVAALGNNDPSTDEGINTTWQFAAPSNRRVTGPYPNFVSLITERYDPLLNASAVTYGPLERDGDVATQRVSVTVDNETTAYTWRVERQTGEPYVGCWMTTSVIQE